ncbi:MAG: hypothetical protein GY696_39550 [Gammaproteobacteria bacterium]|nr:hypothetical protein [Gammaproteobacteria bacterium]
MAALQQRSSYACSLFRILTTALLKNISPHIEGMALVELLKGMTNLQYANQQNFPSQ